MKYLINFLNNLKFLFIYNITEFPFIKRDLKNIPIIEGSKEYKNWDHYNKEKEFIKELKRGL